jgi:hypothetical protein
MERTQQAHYELRDANQEEKPGRLRRFWKRLKKGFTEEELVMYVQHIPMVELDVSLMLINH